MGDRDGPDRTSRSSGLRRNARALGWRAPAAGPDRLRGAGPEPAADRATGRRAAARPDRRNSCEPATTSRHPTSGSRSSLDRSAARRSTATSRARPGRRTCRATTSATRSSSTPRSNRTTCSSRSRTCTGFRCLACCSALFAVAVTVVGGWRGVRSLIALALTLAVVVKIVVPLILAGWDPALVAIVAATGVTLATFLLTEGAKPQTVAAAIGTFGALALTALLAVAFDALARFTELRGSEDATLPPGDRHRRHRPRRADPRGDHLRRAGHPRRRDRHPGRDRLRAPRGEPGPARAGPGAAGDERRPLAHRGHGQHARARLRRGVVAAARPVRGGSPGPAADRVDGGRRRRGRARDRREHRDRGRGPADDGDRRSRSSTAVCRSCRRNIGWPAAGTTDRRQGVPPSGGAVPDR